MSIRSATTCDTKRLLEIYSYYVENTAISFEYTVPSFDEFQRRIASTLKQYPYLVLEIDGIIQGYAYAGAFKSRAAYDYSCETTIYQKVGEFHKCGYKFNRWYNMIWMEKLIGEHAETFGFLR